MCVALLIAGPGLRLPVAYGQGSGAAALTTAQAAAISQARTEIAAHRYLEAQTILRGDLLRENSQAQALLGWLHLDHRIVPRDPSLAFTSFTKAAEAGEASAMTGLALTYRGGLGTPVDSTLAKQWMQRARDAGHPDSFAHFGDFYFEGFGFPKDAATARPLYEQAAALGSAYGKVRLSELLRTADAPRALSLLQQAAEQGDRMGQLRLGQTFLGEQLGLKNDRPLAFRWIREAALGNLAQAQYVLAGLLFQRNTPEHNVTEGAQWITRAALAGFAPAMFLQGRVLETGEGIASPNPAQALVWYQRAAQAGVPNGWLAQSLLVASGKAGPQDNEQAARLAQRGAEAGDPAAQWQMAQWYEQGRGVIRLLSFAYAWANVAAANLTALGVANNPTAIAASAMRDRLAASFDSAQLTQAQGMAREWRSGALAIQLQSSSDPLARAFRQQQPPLGQSLPNLTPPAPSGREQLAGADGRLRRVGSGSGFFISEQGHLITNQHVINQCSQVRLAGQTTALDVIASDPALDLALLRVATATSVKPVAIRQGPARQGEEVATYGYPLQGLLSSGGQINTGIVAALAGLRNDANQLQINAAVQPGSSGGPLLDRRGEVVGVVVSKLNALRVAQSTGDIPQNVNFAIKPETLLRFMKAQGIDSVPSMNSPLLSTETLADRAREFTFAVECWRG